MVDGAEGGGEDNQPSEPEPEPSSPEPESARSVPTTATSIAPASLRRLLECAMSKTKK